MSIITMLCPPEENIDKDRCVKLALIHDMAEALVGDITPPDNVPKGMQWWEWIKTCVRFSTLTCDPPAEEKYRRELQSMEYITEQLLKPISEVIAMEFMGLWEEYEKGESREAVFVKDG